MKRTVIYLACVIGLAVTGARNVRGAEDISVLMQKAIFAEETEGDLDAAIKLYRVLLEQAKNQQNVAATAQYRLAICLHRKGQPDEAVTMLKRLLADYGGPPDLQRRAKERLREWGAPPESLTVREVWPSAIDTSGAVSRDGRFLCFTDWGTGDLAIRDLATGENRRLTDKGPWIKSDAFAMSALFSPDGSQIASWWLIAEGLEEIRLIDISGKAPPRVLLRRQTISTRMTDWSPDGSCLVAMEWKRGDDYPNPGAEPRPGRPVLIDLRTGEVKALANGTSVLEGRVWPRFSPDGRYLVYDRAIPSDGGHRDIFLYDLRAGAERVLIRHSAEDAFLGWIPDSRTFLFKSGRSGSMDLWRATLDEAGLANEPELMRDNIGDIEPMGITTQGRLFYATVSHTSDIYSAELDFETGKLVREPARLTREVIGDNRNPVWSPDGNRLVFVAMQTPRELGVFERYTKTIARFPLKEPVGAMLVQVSWTGDSRQVGIRGLDTQGRYGLFLLDLATGAFRMLAQDGLGAMRGLNAWPQPLVAAPEDGSNVFYFRSREREAWLVRQDTQTGEQVAKAIPLVDGLEEYASAPPQCLDVKKSSVVMRWKSREGRLFAKLHELGGGVYDLTSSDAFITSSRSPNGERIVTLTRQSESTQLLRAHDVSVRPPKELFTLPIQGAAALAGWIPDSRKALLLRPEGGDRSNRQALWTVSAPEGKLQRTELAMRGLSEVALNPDGREVAIQAGDSNRSTVWSMGPFTGP